MHRRCKGGRCKGSGEGRVFGMARLVEGGLGPLHRAFEFRNDSAGAVGRAIAAVNPTRSACRLQIRAARRRARCSADGGDEQAKQNE